MNESVLPQFLASSDPDRYLSDNYLVLDFEVNVKDGKYGSGRDPRNSLALACWHTPAVGLRSRWGGEFDQTALANDIKKADFIVAHNAKYELHWLNRCGVDTSNLLVFDTQIAEYVLLGNLVSGDVDSGIRPVRISLDACCVRRGLTPKDPIVDIWLKNGITIEDMPRKWVEDRCKQDVITTRQLFLHQRNALRHSRRLPVLYTRCLLTPVLAAIEGNGVHLDADRVSATTREYRAKLATLEADFAALTGGINFRSPKQVAGYLYDTLGFPEPKQRSGKPKRTASGLRLANKRVLEGFKAETGAQAYFISLRKDIGHFSSALSKNLEYFKEICDERSSIFHAEFNQTVTATHRLSSTGIREVSEKSVQLTNVPRAFKRLFNARRGGWLIGEVDGAQLEFRVAAFLGNDSQAKRDIADPDWDAHVVTAGAMTGKPYSEIKSAYEAGKEWAKKARQEAKSETFKPLYGGSKGTKAQEAWYKEFKRRYPELNAVQEGWVYEVLARKQLVTPWGLRFYFPHARISDHGYVNVGASVYNYPVQALATAEIIPIAIVHFWHRVKAQKLDDYIVPVNTIHDSLVCEIHPDYVESFRNIARQSFGPDVGAYLHRVYGLRFDVPLGAGIKIASHWGEGQEEKYDYSYTESERKEVA